MSEQILNSLNGDFDKISIFRFEQLHHELDRLETLLHRQPSCLIGIVSE